MIYKDVVDLAKALQEILKAEFPECKFFVSANRMNLEGRTDVFVSLLESPTSPYADFNIWPDSHFPFGVHDGSSRWLSHYELVRQYELFHGISNEVHLTKEGWRLLARVCQIVEAQDGIDHYDITIGQTGMPYRISKPS